jgi:hypothetical protein
MACTSCNKNKPVSVTTIKANLQPINVQSTNIKVVLKEPTEVKK